MNDVLGQSYERCRQLTRAYGTTYYWATQALPKAKRPHVYALYGFCRYADDIVDEVGTTGIVDEVGTRASSTKSARARPPGRRC